MDTAYLWRCFDLCRPKTGLVILLLLASLGSVFGQGYGYKRKHLEHYDDKIIHYGFFFAAPTTRFSVKYNPAFLTADSATRIYSPGQTGFRVGFVTNFFLTEDFDFRMTPAVSLYSREVKYDYPGGSTRTETRESTWVDIPFLLKYKSQRRNNSRMYLLAGASLGFETNVRRNQTAGSSKLATGNTDFALEYGIGFEQFFEYFKFSPEIRFSHGIPNLFRPTNNITSVGLERLTTHTVTIYLNFE
jgi:Outer membrane protein beta-barrel domain